MPNLLLVVYMCVFTLSSCCVCCADSVDFSKSMGVDDLAKWLLQKFGRDYSKDIDKLKSKH